MTGQTNSGGVISDKDGAWGSSKLALSGPMVGLFAARPAASAVGPDFIYIATDTSKSYISTQSGTWQEIVGAGGSGGLVNSVTAGDSTITIAGTATDPTVAVATIAESQVTNLTTDLAGKASTATTISAGTALTGGGSLAANRTIDMPHIGPGPVGPIGDGTHVPVVTIDFYGRVTALTSTAITGGGGGSGSFTVVAKTAGYTANNTELVLCSTNSFTVVPPAATSGNFFAVKLLTAAKTITITPASGTIEGAASDSISTLYQSKTYYADGTNWWAI